MPIQTPRRVAWGDIADIADGIPAVQPERTEHWWHLHAGTCDHGIYVSTLAGESLVHPEMMAGQGRHTFRVPTVGCEPGCEVAMAYVRSWNHEPSEAELESVTPWEYRS